MDSLTSYTSNMKSSSPSPNIHTVLLFSETVSGFVAVVLGPHTTSSKATLSLLLAMLGDLSLVCDDFSVGPAIGMGATCAAACPCLEESGAWAYCEVYSAPVTSTTINGMVRDIASLVCL